jgi:uncharacterized protein YyaL (SSP411 family)
VSALNLLRLDQIFGNESWQKQAEKTLNNFSAQLQENPAALPQMLVALDFYTAKPKQIVLAGRAQATDTTALLREVHRLFIPNKIVLLADGGAGQEFLGRNVSFLRSVRTMDGKATAYVCENFVCQLPTTSASKLAELLQAVTGSIAAP